MKIAIFSDNFYPELSGIADSIIALAQELAKQGHKIRFYAAKYSRKNYLKVNKKFKEIDLGPNIEVRRLFSVPMSSPTSQGRFAIPIGTSIHSLRAWQADVIHTNHVGGIGLEAIIASRRLNIPLVGTSHTPFREFMKYSPIRTEWATNKMLRYVSWYYNQCDFVTAPSNFLFKEMIDYGLKKPHSVLSNPINPEEFRPAEQTRKSELRKKLNLKGPIIIYTGRLAPEKHVDIIIQSFAIVKKTIPDAELVIVGHGVSDESLKQLVKDLNIEHSVKFLGFVNQEKFTELYQASDIFAVASTAEMQCLSMMNAMLSELPVIGVNAGALPEYINSQNGFVVEPGDYKTFAEKILYLIQNPEEAVKLGQQGREYAQQFSGPNIAKEWLLIYEKAINKRRGT